VDIYISKVLHGEQLHVSALGNGHLQVAYETLGKHFFIVIPCNRPGYIDY